MIPSNKDFGNLLGEGEYRETSENFYLEIPIVINTRK
jgi:hypothetical protein